MTLKTRYARSGLTRLVIPVSLVAGYLMMIQLVTGSLLSLREIPFLGGGLGYLLGSSLLLQLSLRIQLTRNISSASMVMVVVLLSMIGALAGIALLSRYTRFDSESATLMTWLQVPYLLIGPFLSALLERVAETSGTSQFGRRRFD